MKVNILDAYVDNEPHYQNILDIFSGEWSSVLPSYTGLKTIPGTARLFEDERIQWANQTLGGFKNLRILELGPLEGGHSYMLQNMGAAEVVAIEANIRAFLKCLCVKEIFGLDRVHFELGDFIPYLMNSKIRHDVVIASGVLYHLQNPIEFLESIASIADKIFLWTHYYDEKIIKARSDIKNKFGAAESKIHKGFHYDSVEYQYKDALNWQGFCGGSRSTSRWLSRNSITGYLDYLGFESKIGFDHPSHPNGPAFALCALRQEERN